MEEQDCGALHYSNLFRMGFTNFLSYENDTKKQLTFAESHEIAMETGIEPANFQLRPNRHQLPLSFVLIRWQLAQRTSRLAISFSMVDHETALFSCPAILADLLPRTWSNSRTRTSVSPQSTQGCSDK